MGVLFDADSDQITYGDVRASSMFHGAVSTFTVGTGVRRTLSDLGTRMGSRQAQEVDT